MTLYDIIAELRREHPSPEASRTLDLVVTELGRTRDNLRHALMNLEDRPVPAAQMAHARWPPPFWGISLDLAVTIHDPGLEAEWLLVDAETPSARGGVMGGWVHIWSAQGRLLASSVQQMLQRPF